MNIESTIRKTIRILLTLLIAAALTLNTGLIASAEKETGEDLTEAFIKDLEEGLARREKIIYSGQSADTSDYWKSLPKAELDMLRKYADVRFQDERFDKLAHCYLSGCEMQFSAAEDYDQQRLFSSLWNGGTLIRYGALCEMHEAYGVTIPQNQIEGIYNYVYNNIYNDYCTNCESSIPRGCLYCPNCGAAQPGEGNSGFYSTPSAFAAQYESYRLVISNVDTAGLRSIIVVSDHL